MGLPTCEVFVLHQPHRSQDVKTQPLADTVLDLITVRLQEGGLLGQPIGTWQSPADRVRSITFQGCDSSYDAYYDLRRQAAISALETEHSVDVVVLPTSSLSTRGAGKRPIKLAVFDMDSTLIEQEVIDELAREIGKYDEVAEITERAMRGELDFAGSLRARVALLKGLQSDIWDKVRSRITFANGAREFCKELKGRGAKMAVLSGGFTPLAEWVKGELGLDYVHANFLEQTTDAAGNSVLNGELVDGKPIVTAEKKRELLLQLAKENGVSLDQVVCVGDGSNDLKMLGEVGSGGGVAIALKAKPKVQLDAPNKLNSQSMTDILYLLGYQKQELGAMKESA